MSVPRRVLHPVTLDAALRERGVELRVLEQGIDTATAEGRAMFGMLSVLAELQRELIVANTRDGLAAARARGRTGGRRPRLGHLAAESSYRPRVFVAKPGPAAAGADARTRTDTAAAAPRPSQPTPDQPATSRPDQPAAAAAATDRQVRYIVDLLDRSAHRADRGPTDPASIATLGREQASAYIEALGGGGYRRTTAAGHPHAGDVAGDSYPRRYRDVRPAAAASPTAAAPAAANRGQTRVRSR